MPLATAAAGSNLPQQQRIYTPLEKIYVLYVPQGETVAQVAQRFAVSEDSITSLRSQMLDQGWSDNVWLIPKAKGETGEAALYPGYVFYTLRKGETLASQSLRNNRSERELTRLNTLVMGEAGVARLKTGGMIMVPAPQAEVTKADPISVKKGREFELRLAQTLSQTAQGLGAARKSGSGVTAVDLLAQQVSGGASSSLSQKAEDLLSPHGRAKVGVQINTNNNDINLALDYLHPLLEGSDDILFGQVGVRQFDERNIGNVGLGYRKLVNEHLMLGANAFIDQDFTRNHTRAGVGVEAWTSQARLAANAYVPVTGWKKSDQDHLNPDTARYDLYERPASGWDARAEVALPGAPRVAGTIKYFQWKGEGVDTLGGGRLTRDPKGYSIGAKWQPIPLVGFSAEHENIVGGDGQWKLGASLTWSFDTDLSSQLNPGSATAMRPLSQARKDFVQREYNLVLNYKKEEKPVAIPFAFLDDTLTLTAPGARTINPLIASSPALQGVRPTGVVRYEIGSVNLATLAPRKVSKLSVTIDPSTGHVTVPAGISAHSVEVLAHLDVNDQPSAMASYKLVILEGIDTDGDGLADDEEAVLGTDPNQPDTDGDGATDLEEVDASTDPLDPDSHPGKGKPVVDVTDIKGVLQVGQTLTGEYSFSANGGDATDASVITWKNGGHADNDADYVLDAGDVGTVLTFEVQAKNSAGVTGNTDSLDTASATGVTGGGTVPPGSIVDPSLTGVPGVDVTDIKGVLQVGQTLTGEYSFSANGGDATDASVITWKNGGHADNDADYVLDTGDVGTVLTFEVQAKNSAGVTGNTDSLDTASATGVTGGGTVPPGSIVDPSLTGVPGVDVTDIKGVLQVGQTLTGEYSFSANGGDATDASVITWKNGGHADNDADYVLDTGDVGTVLTFEVQAKNSAGVTGNTDSLDTASATGVTGGGTVPPGSIVDPSLTGVPGVDVTDIKGVLQVGQTLTGEYSFSANGGDATDASVITWKNGGHADNDADYVLDTGDVGTVLTFEVQAKNSAGVTGNTDSLDTASATGVTGGGTVPPGSIVDPMASGSVIIRGTFVNGFPQVGTPLFAEVTCVHSCAPNMVYQWEIETGVSSDNYVSISGATYATYTPLKEDQRRKIRVTVRNP